jgi:hypothetical protein
MVVVNSNKASFMGDEEKNSEKAYDRN